VGTISSCLGELWPSHPRWKWTSLLFCRVNQRLLNGHSWHVAYASSRYLQLPRVLQPKASRLVRVVSEASLASLTVPSLARYPDVLVVLVQLVEWGHI
jgi:hypothetical protein